MFAIDRHAGVAWLAAGFMFVGFLVHLALDEIYAVDIEDKRLKNSFGTALKLVDRRYPRAAAGMVCALGLAYWLAPSPSDFVAGLSSRDMWAGLNQRMLPKETWFGIVKVPSMVAGSEPTSNGTGTSPIDLYGASCRLRTRARGDAAAAGALLARSPQHQASAGASACA